MIICLCKNVSDRQIRDMAEEGASFREIVHKSQAGTNCGACTADVREVMQCQRRQSQKNPSDD